MRARSDGAVALSLTDRHFVLTPWSGRCTDLPKALRAFLRHDQRLFADLARLIFSLIAEFSSTTAGKPILNAAVITNPSEVGAMLRHLITMGRAPPGSAEC